MKNTLIALSFISCIACHSAKKATETNKLSATNQNETQNDTLKTFTVSFISIGAGTDGRARETFNQFIKEFEQKHSLKLPFEIISWGREGEMDYCFNLKGIRKGIKEEFVNESKNSLKNSKLIRYQENEECKPSKAN